MLLSNSCLVLPAIVKQLQEEISRNHVPSLFAVSVHVPSLILVRSSGGEENGHLPPSPREYRSVSVCMSLPVMELYIKVPSRLCLPASWEACPITSEARPEPETRHHF